MNSVIRIVVILVALVPLAGVAPAQTKSDHYGLRYDLTLKPEEDRAEIALTLSKGATRNIWSLRLHIDPLRHSGFEADGQYVIWSPPDGGGDCRFTRPSKTAVPMADSMHI
jgi:hypothetical protein